MHRQEHDMILRSQSHERDTQQWPTLQIERLLLITLFKPADFGFSVVFAEGGEVVNGETQFKWSVDDLNGPAIQINESASQDLMTSDDFVDTFFQRRHI